jgi:hypothetical protein
MRADRAWSQQNVKPENVEDPVSVPIEEQAQVAVSLDATEVAKAISTNLNKTSQRSKSDENLIVMLSIGIIILAISSLLCALISIVIAASASRSISKLESLLKQ